MTPQPNSTRRTMTRNRPFVTDSWPVLLECLARTGFFREHQLNPEDAPRILVDLVRQRATVIGYLTQDNLTPIGSGTFLRRTDGQYGILTAGHVVGALKTKENIRVLPHQARKKLNWTSIEGKGMNGRGETNNGTSGPDIGWIPLSGEEVESVEARGAMFHNIVKPREVFKAETCGIGVVFGFVEALSTPSDKIIGVHGMLISKTGEMDADEQGWDYGEYAIRDDDPSIPSTHGGVSGSSVWRIDLPLDGSGRNAVILEGVVFAEGPAEDRKLIAHGEGSARIFLQEC